MVHGLSSIQQPGTRAFLLLKSACRVHWSAAMSAYEALVVDLACDCSPPTNIAGAPRLEEPNCSPRRGHIDIRPAACQIPLKPKAGGLAPWQTRRALQLMSSDLSGRFGLREAASACRISVGHFSYAFKQTIGSSPHQWLLARRIERATDLLLNTDQRLSEIALATGFADQSHFTRVFSRRMGAAPPPGNAHNRGEDPDAASNLIIQFQGPRP